jgi:glycerol uptake facilitator-like aquaporin
MLDVFIAELIGTFVFLGVIITSGHATTRSKEALIWLKIGLALSVAIILVGFVSGGMLNPAVSFMLYINNDISFEKMIISIFAQIIGAILAYFYYLYVKNNYKNAL